MSLTISRNNCKGEPGERVARSYWFIIAIIRVQKPCKCIKTNQMTYKEAVEQLQTDIRACYDRVGELRDFADKYEKQGWNEVRNHLRSASLNLEFFKDGLSPDRSELQV
jgi:hypothetical protein